MGGIRKCNSPGQNVTTADRAGTCACAPGSREAPQRDRGPAEIRISPNDCRAFRPCAREISKGKRGVRHQDGSRGEKSSPAPCRAASRNGSAINGDVFVFRKKKPEIVRSRAKSTKGGGWRRQPWHVGSRFARCAVGVLHRADCVSTSDEMHSIEFFCAMQEFFFARLGVGASVAFLPQRLPPSPAKPRPAMPFKKGGLLPNGFTPCGFTLAWTG